MESKFIITKYKRVESDILIKNIFEEARYNFIHRKFSNALNIIEQIANTDNNEYSNEIYLNKALFHHILGNMEEAENYYNKVENNPIKTINFFAFCHRYYNYKKINEINKIKSNEPLFDLYQHNYLNYVLTTKGFNEANSIQNKPYNIYDEQLLNDSYSKIGISQSNYYRDLLSNDIKNILKKSKINNIKTDKKNICIYVNDIQRHKEAAIIFDLINILLEKKLKVYIYFDNIFDNKLVRLITQDVIIRHVVNLNLIEFNNQLAEDKISTIINITGNKLRNNSLALSLMNEKIINIDDITNDTPFLLTDKKYFADFENQEKREKIAVLGDLKYISDEELLFIKNNFNNEKIIFNSSAFDEIEYKIYFNTKLNKLGFNSSSYELLQGIRPFAKYLSTITSLKLAILTTGINLTELSEIVFTKTPIMLLSNNPFIQNLGKLIDLTNYNEKEIKKINNKFEQNLFKKIDKKSIKLSNKYFYDELYIQYQENNKKYDLNFTCNGDIIIFSNIN